MDEIDGKRPRESINTERDKGYYAVFPQSANDYSQNRYLKIKSSLPLQ